MIWALAPEGTRRVRRRLLLILVFGALLAAALPAQSEVRSLTILHTNDLHARFLPDADGRGGFAYLAAAIRQEHKNCPGCLVLNAGDLVQGSPVSSLYKGVPVYRVANLFGFDASALGNHEFDDGPAQARKLMRTGNFPSLSANLVDEHGRLFARPYVVLKANGVRVAVIGLLLEKILDVTTPERMGPYRTQNAVATVRKYLPELQRQADMIIVLGHLENDECADVMRQVVEVSLAVCGHDHRGLEREVRDGARLAVALRGYGIELGRVELKFDTETRRVVSAEWKRIPITSKSFTPAPDVAVEVARWEKKVSRLVDIEIGESRRDLDRKAVLAWAERALRDETGADFAYWNATGIRDDLKRGPVLARHIWNIMPFENSVVIANYKGSELPDVIRNGQAVDPSRTYTVATGDFVIQNPLECRLISCSGKAVAAREIRFRDLLLEWVKKHKVIE